MLTEIAEGVQVHTSEFLQSNAVVVQREAGVLLVDPGIRDDELVGIARDLRESDRTVAAGFSTHPHWDHLLWHADLGTAPRYGTAICAGAIQARLADPEWKAFVARMMPADILEQVTLDEQFGRITGLPADASHIPWDGPEVRILQHNAHAPGHAALLIEERGVLIAGDMLSDILVPVLNAMSPDPVADYLAALQLLEDAAANVVVPGHGSVATGVEVQARIDSDRAYLTALQDGTDVTDARLDVAWVHDLHAGQVERIGRSGEGKDQ